MKGGFPCFFPLALLLAAASWANAQNEPAMPKAVEAGNALSIPTAGSGKTALYLIGPNGVYKQTAENGRPIEFHPGEITNAGHYVAILIGDSSTRQWEFDVLAAKAANLSFVAKPSRLPVSQNAGISGVVYVFDAFHNLVFQPLPVIFRLSEPNIPSQEQKVETQTGVAWVQMNSSPKAGTAEFDATAGNIDEKRVVQLIPGDPCNLRMDARRSGPQMILQTAPVRDCSGNALPDGTSVTFTETRDGRAAASVDVPLKHDIAQTELPAYDGAVLTVATGVAMGNEVRVGDK